ncbi:two-component system osmolarity sensor histidine kinase EnvZ [Roseovarius halotolerans]|uniref:histidine kinase n=1 Tax=Roseovarius halotolerans TaxID=505353 RepID=A0A1X6YLA7_9RHOB|nr:ATP-binding protein [Roseovarius halotolerans]RKT34475.1 two-component system osmolarity sensor histidine kinase EnvZ [Roseovarius halotolerans]SLN22942.1 Osmolarity sensor protein EnvZ [Roseovarius halotolerans]
MSFNWLKSYTPRGLYWRAALILLLPVVSLFLVMAVVFLQRHFEGVTTQMTRTASREVAVLRASNLSAEETAKTSLARSLGIKISAVTEDELPETHQRRWYDLTGIVVIREFEALISGLRAVDLPDDRVVRLYILQPDGVWRMEFERARVSPKNAHQIFVNMVFFGVLMTVIAYFYLRNQLRPITRLARAAEAFGRGRHEPYRPAGAIEVRAAGNAFLDMRARIERQIEQRTLMLSGVSHDLRTPLTRLKLGLSMLDHEDRIPMQQDVADMERLLDEFLAFARGAQEGAPVALDPVALVERIVEDCQRADIAAELVEVKGSGLVQLREGAIRRAIENLINNAVRYGSKAELSVLMTERALRIRVEDDGPGIPASRREEAMKPFARLEPARNQNRGTGVGLGLSIAMDIARAHGGTLRLGESQRLGGLRADIVIGR